MQRNSLQLDGGRVDLLWLRACVHFELPRHIMHRDSMFKTEWFPVFHEDYMDKKSLPVATVIPIHITSTKIDSHGRSWLTNVCSKPSQSEQGSQPKQTFPANWIAPGDRQRLTSLAADQAHFQPWLNKAWAKKTSVTQLHDAESSRGPSIKDFCKAWL